MAFPSIETGARINERPVFRPEAGSSARFVRLALRRNSDTAFESRAIVALGRHGAVFGAVIWWLTP